MTRPGDEYDGPEPNFADVMNAFSFDSGRSAKKRRWGRRRAEDAEAAPETPSAWSAAPPSEVDFPLPPPAAEQDQEYPEAESGASAVRPYAWTRGRTKSGFDLAIETLLSTSQRGREQMMMLPVEHRAVAQLCEQTRSVAEVAALLSIPLGVARVLLGDMAGLGLVMVHQTVSSAGNGPDLALMERVLGGLRRL
ncbi:MAG: DUF742 domain-containing protein [Pseudonocardia sp.]